MQHYRCKCGKATGFGSMGFQDCQGCDECGTTYAQHPDHHKKRIDHDWEDRYNSKTGKQDRKICNRCGEMELIEEVV